GCEASQEQDCGNACGCGCEASQEQDCGNACGSCCESAEERDCQCGDNCDCGENCDCESAEEEEMERNCMSRTAVCTRTDINCGDNSREQNMVDHCDTIECD
ncbi:MAG: hypothetical protein R3Y23_07090, partial [Bacillota bacterium]